MSKRVGVNYAAVFKSDSICTQGVINQLSEGGLSFCCSDKLDTDSAGLFVFNAFDDEPPVSVLGEFVYMLPGKQGRDVAQASCQYGVRLLESAGEQYENIIKIVRFATIRKRYSGSEESG